MPSLSALPISRVKLNLLANFAGTGWSALMQLAFIPIYIRLMGIEAYGLIGFYLTLQSTLQILDFGLSPTMNREMARYSVLPEQAGEARDFVRTVELGYWAVGVAIGLAVWALAPFLATHWIKAEALPASVVQSAVVSMGLLATIQWPLTFYQGGLLGLQRQTALNLLLIATTTISHLGAVAALWLVRPSITVFLGWQIVTGALRVTLMTALLWRSLPPAPRAARFNLALLRSRWRFAAGMSGITLLSLVITQLDKVVLSNRLPLALFGYYTLAGVAASSLLMVVGPVFNALFPRFSALVALNDETTLRSVYHYSAQLLAVLVLPAAALLAFFSYDVLRLWTGDPVTAQNAAPILTLLAIGTGLNAIQNVPYGLQLAYGWTRLVLYVNAISLVPFVLAIFGMATRYGAVGAAWVWLALNLVYMLATIPLLHRRLLKGEARRWFVEDVGRPLAAAAGVVAAGWWLFRAFPPPLGALTAVPLVGLSSLAAAVLAAPLVRAWLFDQWARVSARRKGSASP